MTRILKRLGPIRTIVVSGVVAALLCSSFAVADSLITSKDIKNGTIKPADLSKKLRTKINQASTAAAAIPGSNGSNGAKGNEGTAGKEGAQGKEGPQGKEGAAGKEGPQGQQGPPGLVSYGSPHWGSFERNTEGTAVAALRAGPYGGAFGGTPEAPPIGEGSLELNVMSPTSKVDFGDELDYQGQAVSDLTNVGFSVYTTAENSSRSSAPNMPSIRFEINPMTAGGTTTTYSTLVFTPTADTAPGKWTHIDATTEGLWGLTGGQFNEPATMNERCGLNGTRCTFAQIQTFLATGGGATIYTVAVGKGKDFTFEGAVDGLEINNQTVDFEPNGVNVTE